MSALRGLRGPADLRTLRPSELTGLAAEMRDFLVDSVARRGGHLGSNLGVVEITIALHRVFDSPADPILFDTGHQAYPHKLLTGRMDGFASLRARNGIAGYPSAEESTHDVIANSHASTALAYADGMAKAFELTSGRDRTVVAVVGDGSLTGGLAWEALNNLGASRRRVVVVLNDNGRSYSPTVGALAAHLARLRREPAGYADLVELLGSSGLVEPAPPDGTVTAGSGTANFFAQLGMHYLGPVDGHDIAALETAFTDARDHARGDGPVVVHCVTRKGRGYAPAEQDEVDHLHSTGTYDPATGRAPAPSADTWTDVFAREMCVIARDRDDVVGVTAAMLHPTGLASFAAAYPDRVYDVGIAEQYATTSAAGLALGGRHPVVAVYSTFLNRAFDQTVFDVALHRQPVTFVIDRAGITGPDGPSHHGMWDLAVLRAVPGMRVAAPRDAERLREELREAVAVHDGPTALRFPKATAGDELPAVYRAGDLDVLHVPEREDVLLVAVGAMAQTALDAAHRLATDGVGCTVVDPRWPLPVAAEITELARRHGVAVTVEDGVRQGGVGEAIRQALADADARTPVHVLGLPTAFIPHGSRAELLAETGLDAAGIVAGVHDAVRRYAGSSGSAAVPDKIDTENFPVALRVLPADVRADLVAIYRFARYVDDVGDESAGDRNRGLDAVDADLDVLFTGGRPALPAVSGLRTFVDRCATPDGPFRRLVQANRQDQVVGRYATFEQLRDYCRLSADPVGELVLHVFGCATPERVALSDRVCTALQVIEHLQDVREDYERGRIYLPKDDMDRFGVVESALGASAATLDVRRLVAFEARRAAGLLDDGTPLLRTLHGWARVCVTGYVAGGRAALGALRRAGYDPLPGAPKAGKVDLMRAALRLVAPSSPAARG